MPPSGRCVATRRATSRRSGGSILQSHTKTWRARNTAVSANDRNTGDPLVGDAPGPREASLAMSPGRSCRRGTRQLHVSNADHQMLANVESGSTVSRRLKVHLRDLLSRRLQATVHCDTNDGHGWLNRLMNRTHRPHFLRRACFIFASIAFQWPDCCCPPIQGHNNKECRTGRCGLQEMSILLLKPTRSGLHSIDDDSIGSSERWL